MTFTDNRCADIDRLIGDGFDRNNLIAIAHDRCDIEYGKAIFHVKTLPVEVGHHMLNTGVILEAIRG